MSKIFLLFTILLIILSSSAAQSEFASTKILGIRQMDNGSFGGVVADLTVEMRPGTGHVYVDTFPLTKIDTQASARLAKEVACEILDKNCDKYDFLYTVRSPYVMVGGPSAGAALTIATMAVLHGVEINKNVAITGTINPAGSIGDIGGVYEKVVAAAENNITLVIIPKSQEFLIKENKTINLVAEAKEQFNIEVIPVRDIAESYKYFTGYEIQQPVINKKMLASERLTNSLMELSSNLLPYAENSYLDAKNILKTSTVLEKEQITSIIEKSEKELDNARKSFENNQFYSAASFAMRSTIYSLDAIHSAEYYKTKNVSYVESEILRVEKEINDFEVMFLKNRNVDSIEDIEILSLVIDRIKDSEDTIKEAKEKYKKGDIETAIYLTSYAEVRKNTAYQWLTLVNKFKGYLNIVFDLRKFQTLALDRIEQARNAIIYSQVITGYGTLPISTELLTDAENAYNEQKYIFSIFLSSKARATANLAFELSNINNNNISSKIYELEKEAIVSIQKANDAGLTPILALSYLEFAKNFYDTDPFQALVYLSYSKEMAKISEEITKAIASDYFSPIKPEIKKQEEKTGILKIESSTVESLSVLFTGIAAGVLISIVYFEKRFED